MTANFACPDLYHGPTQFENGNLLMVGLIVGWALMLATKSGS